MNHQATSFINMKTESHRPRQWRPKLHLLLYKLVTSLVTFTPLVRDSVDVWRAIRPRSPISPDYWGIIRQLADVCRQELVDWRDTQCPRLNTREGELQYIATDSHWTCLNAIVWTLLTVSNLPSYKSGPTWSYTETQTTTVVKKYDLVNRF